MSHSRTAIAGCPCPLVPAFPAPCHSSGDTNAREKRQTMVLQEGLVNKQSHPDRLSPHCSNLPGTSDNWNRTGDACRTWGHYDVMPVRYGCTGAPRRCRRGGRSSLRHPLSLAQDFRGQTELNLETVWLKTPLPRWLFFGLEIQTSCPWSKPADLVGPRYGIVGRGRIFSTLVCHQQPDKKLAREQRCRLSLPLWAGQQGVEDD